MAPRQIPLQVRARVERWWRPERIEVWWTKPVMGFGERPPCEMPDWELEELLDRIEQGRDLSGISQPR